MKKIIFSILLCVASYVSAETVTLVIGFSPGSSTDIVARTIATVTENNSTYKIVTENRPGASGQIAWQAVEKDPQLKLVGISGGMSIFDPLTDPDNHILDKARYIGPVASSPLVLAHSPRNSVTIKELFSKTAKPQRFNIGIVGPAHQFLAEFIKKNSPHDVQTILYKGTGDAYRDLLGGSIELMIDSYSYFKTMNTTNLVLGIATAKPQYGIEALSKYAPGAVVSNIWGVGVRADIADTEVQPLLTAINQSFKLPQSQRLFTDQGYELDLNPRGDYMKRVALPEFQRWQRFMSK